MPAHKDLAADHFVRRTVMNNRAARKLLSAPRTAQIALREVLENHIGVALDKFPAAFLPVAI